MFIQKLTALGLGLSLIWLSACASENQDPSEATKGYLGFSGQMSQVISSNRFRIRGVPMDIKLFGVKPPLDQAKAEAGEAQLYDLLRGRDVICVTIPGVRSAHAIVAYCQIDNRIELTSYLLQHGFGRIDCEDYARKHGRVKECQS